jgi:hypothetical protein
VNIAAVPVLPAAANVEVQDASKETAILMA